MAGHSKWAKIKRKKAANDAKKGKLFTKLLREIQVAARLGGEQVDANPRLKTAISAAKSMGVPSDNINKAIKRGTGDQEGVEYEEVTYEGYGPGGVAVLVKALTENKNRTVADIRHAFTKCNGSLASTNSVAYLFKKRGIVTIKKDLIEEDKLYDIALDAGAEDISDEGDTWEVSADPSVLGKVERALSEVCGEVMAEVSFIPDTTVEVTGNDARNMEKLLELLDDLDDVQDVYSNCELKLSEER
ncbi:MAG: YebC/PmpR family DNA-binding transcriptional regulator [Candidatus Dadabacteria bacterium]|nr:MAG: YebC/PmpR family DNA-binding transcriptional regulator [Candidatus Dadabacteria bacterium]